MSFAASNPSIRRSSSYRNVPGHPGNVSVGEVDGHKAARVRNFTALEKCERGDLNPRGTDGAAKSFRDLNRHGPPPTAKKCVRRR